MTPGLISTSNSPLAALTTALASQRHSNSDTSETVASERALEAAQASATTQPQAAVGNFSSLNTAKRVRNRVAGQDGGVALRPGESFADRLNALRGSASRTPVTGLAALNEVRKVVAKTTAPSTTSPGRDSNQDPIDHLNTAQRPVSSAAQRAQWYRAAALQPGETPRDRLNAALPGGALSGPQQGAGVLAQAAPAEQQQLRKVAGDLVSNALILPILKQIRRSVWSQNSIFKPGAGENAFGPEFDTQLADRVAHSPRMSLTDALASRLATHRPGGAEGVKSATKGASIQGVDLHA